MFRDLRSPVTSTRRIVAFGLLILLLGACGWILGFRHAHPELIHPAKLVFAALGSYLAIRLFTYIFLDPLLSDLQTAVPGFARDLAVFALYVGAAFLLLHKGLEVNLGALLGTGAIAAAIVGLSLQETLGNLFAGISLHLDEGFRIGDWVEVTGNLRGGPGQETFVGMVETMTWRSVQLITENGDTAIFPNRILAQAVVTNLYAPSGLHRRTLKVTVEPHGPMVNTLAALEQALGGLPHYPHHKPTVVTHSFDMGGVVLEVRWWALGWRHGRAANYQAARLIQTVLNRQGVPLLGPHGATTPHAIPVVLKEGEFGEILKKISLPEEWTQELQAGMALRRAAPGEGVIRAGDLGESLFVVLTGQLQVVEVTERTEPYTGLFWEILGELGPGDMFGEGSLLTGAPRNATVVAVTPCELAELPKKAFEAGLRRNPDMVERLVDLMESRSLRIHGLAKAPNARDQWLAEIKAWFRL